MYEDEDRLKQNETKCLEPLDIGVKRQMVKRHGSCVLRVLLEIRLPTQSLTVCICCTFPLTVSIAWRKFVHVPLSTHSDSTFPRFAKDNARQCR